MCAEQRILRSSGRAQERAASPCRPPRLRGSLGCRAPCGRPAPRFVPTTRRETAAGRQGRYTTRIFAVPLEDAPRSRDWPARSSPDRAPGSARTARHLPSNHKYPHAENRFPLRAPCAQSEHCRGWIERHPVDDRRRRQCNRETHRTVPGESRMPAERLRPAHQLRAYADALDAGPPARHTVAAPPYVTEERMGTTTPASTTLCTTSLALRRFRHSRWRWQSVRPQGAARHAGSQSRPLLTGCTCGSRLISRSGLVIPKIGNVGVPTAAPMCINPESFPINAALCAISAAVSERLN